MEDKFTLDVRAFLSALDYDRPFSVVRDTNDWLRFFEIAEEQVSKYGLNGSKIPVDSTVYVIDKGVVRINREQGYKGILGHKATYKGPVKNDAWSERYMLLAEKTSRDSEERQSWVYRPSWWRVFAVLE